MIENVTRLNNKIVLIPELTFHGRWVYQDLIAPHLVFMVSMMEFVMVNVSFNLLDLFSGVLYLLTGF